MGEEGGKEELFIDASISWRCYFSFSSNIGIILWKEARKKEGGYNIGLFFVPPPNLYLYRFFVLECDVYF